MKKIIPVLLVVFFIASCTPGDREEQETPTAVDTVSAQKEVNPFIPKTPPVQSGDYEVRYKSGLLKAKGFYKNGEREGQWMSWYEDGQAWSESVYQSGLKNGKSTVWYENGKKRYEGFFTNDVKSGKWKYWDRSGNLIKEIDCDKEKP